MFDQYVDMQPVADQFKALIRRLDMLPKKRSAMLETVSEVERLDWQPVAFADVLSEIAPATLTVEDGRFRFDSGGTRVNIPAVAHFVLERYAEVISGRVRMYGTDQAGDYLGLTVDGMKYHIHRQGNLSGTMVGGSLVFSLRDLYEFERNKRKVGRSKQMVE